MKNIVSVGRYGTVGLELVISLLLGIFGGQWLDKKFGTSYFFWIGLVVGAFAGFRGLMKAANAASREIEREDRKEPGKFGSGGTPSGVSSSSTTKSGDYGEMDENYDATPWKDDDKTKNDWGHDERDQGAGEDKSGKGGN